MSAKAVRTESIAAAAPGRAIKSKGRVRHSDATERVQTATATLAAEVAAILTRAGIAAGSRATLERGVVDGSGAAGNVSSSTLSSAATASILLVAGDVASNAASSVAVVDSRPIDVERAAFEIDR